MSSVVSFGKDMSASTELFAIARFEMLLTASTEICDRLSFILIVKPPETELN